MPETHRRKPKVTIGGLILVLFVIALVAAVAGAVPYIVPLATFTVWLLWLIIRFLLLARRIGGNMPK